MIEATPSNVTVKAGDTLELKCDAYGYLPEYKLRWFLDDGSTEIPSNVGGRYLTEEKEGDHEAQIGDQMPGPSLLGVLTIKEPVESDSGTYHCGTSKEDAVSVELTVEKGVQNEPVSPGGKWSPFCTP